MKGLKANAYNKVIMAHTIFSQNLYHKKYRLYQCITTLLQKVLKMKLSSGKLQFWEWEKTL